MKKNSFRLEYAFYIIIIPIVLVMILLNSGYLQRWFTAVTVDGEDYNAVGYNYYYFRCYRDFVDSEDFASSGLDLTVSLSDQQYDETATWKDHFTAQAEERMVLANYYDGLAREEGYTFSQEELAPIQEKLDEISQLCSETGLAMADYFPAYYGAGMTQDAFTRELEREVRAHAYRTYLAQGGTVSQQEVEQYLQSHQVEEYALADLWLIELEAVPARADGQVGEQQLTELEARLGRLEARMSEGRETMAELSDKFADRAWGEHGRLSGVGRADLPELVADWCFAPEREAGDTAALMDRQAGTAYLVRLEGYSGSAAQRTALVTLASQVVEELDAQALEDTPVEYHTIGMHLTTN